jgi:hypothetical protein
MIEALADIGRSYGVSHSTISRSHLWKGECGGVLF